MGSWGPKLYQDDLAEDVRDYYIDQLRRGRQGVDITQDLLVKYKTELLDSEDASVFWFALADTQWELGRLEEKVKETALEYIHEGNNLKHWKIDNSKMADAREQTLEKLRQKLLSTQPSEKKLTQYRIYQCEWNFGDVFAYRLESDLAKEKGLYGRYFLLQKVDESVWHPGHIVPIVYVKLTSGTNLPSNIDEYNQMEYIQTWFTKYEERFWPIDMSRPREDIAEKSKMDYQVDEYGFLPQYRVRLLNTSKKVIPRKLIYIGNYANVIYPRKEFFPHSKENLMTVSWKQFGETFETKMIKLYCGHNLRQFGMYTDINV